MWWGDTLKANDETGCKFKAHGAIYVKRLTFHWGKISICKSFFFSDRDETLHTAQALMGLTQNCQKNTHQAKKKEKVVTELGVSSG